MILAAGSTLAEGGPCFARPERQRTMGAMASLSTTPQADPAASLPARFLPRGSGSALDRPQRIHLLGAGGAGVSGAAHLLQARGHRLTGHDRELSPFGQALEATGVSIACGPSGVACLPEDATMVLRSAAIDAGDPQWVAARERGLPVWKYAEVLGWLSQRYRVLACAGTHGKTTTSWMLHHALQGIPGMAGAGALVGGLHRELGVNAVAPQGDTPLVVEACEYDRTFLRMRPRGALITNIEPDHLDYYGDMAAIEEAFASFAAQVSPEGLLVVGSKVPERVEAFAACQTWRLGREVRIEIRNRRRGMGTFRLKGPGWVVPEVSLAVPGDFNVENAALAIALAMGRAQRWGLDLDQAALGVAQQVARFEGAGRRFEPWGTFGGIELVHDYAHHPTEVRVTLEAARRVMPGKPIHVLFQPHQYSRTARFLRDFAQSLEGAARVVVADVYGARAHIDSQGAGAEDLVRELVSCGVPAEYGGPPSEAGRRLARGLQGACAGLILGAGDIDGIRGELQDRLAVRCP